MCTLWLACAHAPAEQLRHRQVGQLCGRSTTSSAHQPVPGCSRDELFSSDADINGTLGVIHGQRRAKAALKQCRQLLAPSTMASDVGDKTGGTVNARQLNSGTFSTAVQRGSQDPGLSQLQPAMTACDGAGQATLMLMMTTVVMGTGRSSRPASGPHSATTQQSLVKITHGAELRLTDSVMNQPICRLAVTGNASQDIKATPIQTTHSLRDRRSQSPGGFPLPRFIFPTASFTISDQLGRRPLCQLLLTPWRGGRQLPSTGPLRPR